jgi:MFS family permease
VIGAIRRLTPGLFYGWVVVAAAMLVVALSAGVRFSFGVALPAMQRRWTLGALSLAVVVNSVVVGAAQPFIGRLVDRLGARAILAGGFASGVHGASWFTTHSSGEYCAYRSRVRWM